MRQRPSYFETYGGCRASGGRGVWTPLSVGLMVLGFVVFWPIGLAVLAYNIWAQPGDFRRWTDRRLRPVLDGARSADGDFAAAWRRTEADARSLFGELREGWRRWLHKRQG